GRAGADKLCRITQAANFPDLPSTLVNAFLSVDSTDQMADIQTQYGYSYKIRVVGPTGIVLAKDWADLMDGKIDTTLALAGVTSRSWFSGSNADGSLGNSTCAGWTS